MCDGSFTSGSGISPSPLSSLGMVKRADKSVLSSPGFRIGLGFSLFAGEGACVAATFVLDVCKKGLVDMVSPEDCAACVDALAGFKNGF